MKYDKEYTYLNLKMPNKFIQIHIYNSPSNPQYTKTSPLFFFFPSYSYSSK